MIRQLLYSQFLTSCGGPKRTHSGTPMSLRVKIIPATQRRSLNLIIIIITDGFSGFTRRRPDRPPTFSQLSRVRKMLSSWEAFTLKHKNTSQFGGPTPTEAMMRRVRKLTCVPAWFSEFLHHSWTNICSREENTKSLTLWLILFKMSMWQLLLYANISHSVII